MRNQTDEEIVLEKISNVPNKQHIFEGWTNTVVTDFKFIKLLGKGGFGQVWLTTRLSDNINMACKVVDKNRSKSTSSLQALHDEVSLMKQLQHPGIIKFHCGYETKKKLYIMMELCTGGELLAKILSKNGITEAQCISYCTQILDVLEFAHARGIIHCDLKPENVIFVKGSEQLKVIDFGLAKASRRHEWQTKVGGTPTYIAPECCSRHYGEECDIWAVGVMCFEMLHGYLPFKSTKRDPYKAIKMAKKGLQPSKPGKGPWINTDFGLSSKSCDFILSLVVVDPSARLNASEALLHPWIIQKDPKDISLDHVVEAFKIRHSMTNVNKFLKNMVHSKDMQNWLVEDIKAAFNKFDVSGTGELSWEEFKKAMVTLTVGMNATDVIHLFDAMDANHSHTISIDQFLNQYAYQQAIQHEDYLWKICKNIDTNETGKINAPSIDVFIKNNPDMEENITDEIRLSLENLFREGSVSYETFICAMSETDSNYSKLSKERVEKKRRSN